MTGEIVLSAQNVRKTYDGAEALRGVNFALHAGEVHGLIGANGAGKSTLCKIISGIERPTRGEVVMNGAPVTFASVRDAVARGIDIVHQELSLFPDLSVAENMFMGRELRDRFGLIDHGEQRKQAKAALERLGHPIDPETPIHDLPVGLQQIVEIAKVLTHQTRVLLLDEPTSALSQSEIPRLFEIIRGLAAQGVAIVYISHRLDELLAVCDRVTVLRDGEIVGEALCSDINPAWIVERMTGRATSPPRPSEAAAAGACALSVRKLSLPHREGRVTLDDVSLDVHAGEIVGLYGLMGAGRTELLSAIMGVHRDARGEIKLAETNIVPLDIAGRVAAGLAFVPEDRQRDGLVRSLSVMHNMTLSSLPRFARAGWLRSSEERTASGAFVERLGIKLPNLAAHIHALSGGNQQKVLISRCLMSQPKVLLLDEPTRGVDVAAKADIMAQMRQLAQEGVAIVFTSSEASEMLEAASRIVVMSRGRIARTFTPQEASLAALAEAASLEATEMAT